jgi:hypothetical protein
MVRHLPIGHIRAHSEKASRRHLLLILCNICVSWCNSDGMSECFTRTGFPKHNNYIGPLRISSSISPTLHFPRPAPAPASCSLPHRPRLTILPEDPKVIYCPARMVAASSRQRNVGWMKGIWYNQNSGRVVSLRWYRTSLVGANRTDPAEIISGSFLIHLAFAWGAGMNREQSFPMAPSGDVRYK